MKAIRIPDVPLLDTFGRSVAINSQDFHQSAIHDATVRQNKNSAGTSPDTKHDINDRLAVIGR